MGVCKQVSTNQISLYHQKQPSRRVLKKRFLKICCKFTGEHPCRSAISIKLQSNFIEIALRHGYSPVNLLYIFRTPFPRNTSVWLLLYHMSKILFTEALYSVINGNALITSLLIFKVHFLSGLCVLNYFL